MELRQMEFVNLGHFLKRLRGFGNLWLHCGCAWGKLYQP